jgi:hypothetical protein
LLGWRVCKSFVRVWNSDLLGGCCRSSFVANLFVQVWALLSFGFWSLCVFVEWTGFVNQGLEEL